MADLNAAFLHNLRAAGNQWDITDLPLSLQECMHHHQPTRAFSKLVMLLQMAHGLFADGRLTRENLSYLQDPSRYVNLPISGKGLWVWKLSHLGKKPVSFVKSSGAKHVIVKVAEGSSIYGEPGVPAADRLAILEEFFEKMNKAGVTPIPWVYAHSYPQDTDKNMPHLLKQAAVHGHLVRNLSARMLVINAEKYFRSWYYGKNNERVENPHYRVYATQYIRLLRKAGVVLGLSSYGYPSVHSNFAWRELNRGVDVLMPQAYWSVKRATSGNPLLSITRTVEEWYEAVGGADYFQYSDARQGFAAGPFICPSGAMYQTRESDGSWRTHWHSRKDIWSFVDMCDDLLLPFASFWLGSAKRTGFTKGDSFRVTPSQWKGFSDSSFIGGQSFLRKESHGD